ncbi:MAG: hypothetical protein PHU25_01215 [Deltaproteobacteria bacterium]|nr:hypothetical protein [Deltaproteobacteria bacterium]
MRVFIRSSETGAEDNPTTLIKAVKHLGTRDVELFLPEIREVVSLGWVPEIVYKMAEGGDLLDIIIRPDPKALLGWRKVDKGDSPDSQHETPAMASETGTVVDEKQHEREAGASSPEAPRPHTLNDELLYRVIYENREIRVNGFVLSKPNYDSENDVVFEHVFHNANRKVGLEEIETAIHRPLKKRLGEVVRDLGFTGDLKAIFFPDVSKAAVRFVNPVTAADFAARRLRAPRLGTGL